MAEREMERRYVTAEVEYRDDDQGPTIIGHAATFNQPYQVGYFSESIHPDAFKRTLSSGPDVRLLVDHEGQPLARTKSGTLQLGTDGTGLTVRATLDPTDPDVQRLVPKMRRGDMDQMSFAFRVPNGGEAWDHSGETPKRTIREASLAGGDVSIVTYPANENASVALRKRETRDAHATLLHSLLDEIRDGRRISLSVWQPAWNALQEDSGAFRLDELGGDLTLRAAVSTADMNDLPDSDFAYIEPGGEKDSSGKTTPRSLRHFPIQDAAHVRNALARAADSPFGDKAMPAIKAAAKKFGIEVSEKNSGIPSDLARRIIHARSLRRSA